MKKSLCTKTLAVLLIAVCAAGCAGTKVNIESYVPQNVARAGGRTVTGAAGGFQLFWLIPININSRQARAYAELKKRAGDAYITDVKVKETWKYGFVGTVHITEFEATAYPKTGK